MLTWVTGDKVQEIRGLSTDTKPIEVVDGIIPNGTVFFEMDTGKVFLFDFDNKKWLEI